MWKVVVIGKMKKVKVLHQVLDPRGSGGVSSEFRALKNSKLSEDFEFESMILTDFNPGLNLHDIMFYYKYIKKSKPDIIHIRGAAIDGLNAIIAAKLAKTGKILVTVHGMYSDLVYIGKLKKWISKYIIEKLSFHFADGISCVCDSATKRICFKKYQKKMLPYVYNRMPYYDLSKKEQYKNEIRRTYGIPENAVVGIYVGRMTKEKGLKVFLKSIESLQNMWPQNLVLLFVGDGEYRNTLELACENMQGHICFVGNQKEVKKYYAASDFFILPSLHENHSISLLEACAAGLPCIATECGGNQEIIDDGVTGIIIPINDDRALTNALIEMYDEKKREWYKNNIISADYSKFSNDSVDDALKTVYEKIMEK